MRLKFVKKQFEIGEVWSLFFRPLEPIQFVAGQYLNLTMPDVPPAVAERIFSITSAPHEELLQFTTILGTSLFKQKLFQLREGEIIEADQLGGDFTYDLSGVILNSIQDPINIKRLFIAGGIGITPYLSIIRDRVHKKQPINATLLYAGKDENRPFANELEEAVNKDPTLMTKVYSDTRLTLEQLQIDVPNIEDHIVYLAGSQKFSEELGEGLITNGFPRNQIKYDYFDGYIDIEY